MIHICFLVWASSISISKWEVFACLTAGVDFRGPAESTSCDKEWKFLMLSFSMDRVAPWENNSLLLSEGRDLGLMNIVWTTRRICHVNRRHFASVFPLHQLNTAGETRKVKWLCHSKSSVLFSRVENKDWSYFYI